MAIERNDEEIIDLTGTGPPSPMSLTRSGPRSPTPSPLADMAVDPIADLNRQVMAAVQARQLAAIAGLDDDEGHDALQAALLASHGTRMPQPEEATDLMSVDDNDSGLQSVTRSPAERVGHVVSANYPAGEAAIEKGAGATTKHVHVHQNMVILGSSPNIDNAHLEVPKNREKRSAVLAFRDKSTLLPEPATYPQSRKRASSESNNEPRSKKKPKSTDREAQGSLEAIKQLKLEDDDKLFAVSCMQCKNILIVVTKQVQPAPDLIGHIRDRGFAITVCHGCEETAKSNGKEIMGVLPFDMVEKWPHGLAVCKLLGLTFHREVHYYTILDWKLVKNSINLPGVEKELYMPEAANTGADGSINTAKEIGKSDSTGFDRVFTGTNISTSSGSGGLYSEYGGLYICKGLPHGFFSSRL